MLIKSTTLTYPFLAILSTGKKSFASLGRLIKISGRAVAKLLPSSQNSFEAAHLMCQSVFARRNKLYLIIDDTLIKKIYATNMRGTGMFYDTKLGRCINAFRLVTALLSDGKCALPIGCDYLFAKEIIDLCSERFPSKDAIAKAFVRKARELFPDKNIYVLADGLYASVKLIDWFIKNKIQFEMRMHSNRVVTYKGLAIKLSALANKRETKLTGRQTARTVSVEWHGLLLEISIVKRVDKNDRESIVFQVSNYKAEPREHVKAYGVRWKTEKAYRTSKQHLGLGDCYSKNLDIQRNHVAAILLSYAIAQLEVKKYRFKNAEEAIRDAKERFAKGHFFPFDKQFSFSDVFAA